MSIPTHPSAVQAYRNETTRGSATGIMSPTFRCRGCHQFKRVVGRKRNKAGQFICVACQGGDDA